MPALTGRALRIVVVAGIATLVVAAIVLSRLPPSIPAGAASMPVAVATLPDLIATDPSSAPEPVPPPRLHGGACLPRIERGAGWLDLCWEALQLGSDEDPAKDYYFLRVYGSHQGFRWLVARSQLVGDPGDGVYDVWPDGTYEGGCRRELVGLLVPLTDLPMDDICGRTEAHLDAAHWAHDLIWTCEGCLGPDATTRGISTYAVVGMPEGTIPSWDLFADGGS